MVGIVLQLTAIFLILAVIATKLDGIENAIRSLREKEEDEKI